MPWINLKILLNTIIFVSNILWGIFILFKNKKNKVNQWFFLLTLSISSWLLGTFLFDNFINSYAGLLGARLAFAAVVILIYSFLMFILHFTNSVFLQKKIINYLNFTFVLFLFFVCIKTNLIVEEIKLVNNLHIAKYGKLYYLFIAYLFAYLFFGFYSLIKKYRLSTGLIKLKIKYIFLGFAIAIFYGLVTNFILPNITHNSESSKFGPFSSIIVILFISYAIVRYRLFDIRLMIKRKIIYPLFLTTIVLAYSIGALFFTNKLINITSFSFNYLVYFLTLFLGILIFDPIKRNLYKFIDNYLLPLTYNRELILKECNRILRENSDLNISAELLIKTIKKKMGLKKIAFLIMSKKLDHLFIDKVSKCVGSGCSDKFFILPNIIKFLEKNKKVLIREELERIIEEKTVISQDLLKVKEELDRFQIALIIPITLNYQLAGFLILGEKNNREAYTVEDLLMFKNLILNIERNIESNKLYRQIKKQKEELNKNYQELKKITDLIIGRELRISELKQRIKELESNKN